MQNIELKIIIDSSLSTITTIDGALKYLNDIYNGDDNRTIYITEKVDIDTLKAAINNPDWITIKDGVTGGCYGARDNNTYGGLTLFVSPELFQDRFIDCNSDEIFNIHHALNEFGTKLDIDVDGFYDTCELLDFDIKHDNTYNHENDGVYMLFDIDFKLIENGDTCFMIVKYHCGGDIRGNYTSEVVYKFDSIDDAFSVIYPYSILSEDEIA